MALSDDKRITLMQQFGAKLQEVIKLMTPNDVVRLFNNSDYGYDYGEIRAHLQDTHKLILEKIAKIEQNQQSSKSQIQRDSQISRKEGDWWDADRP